MLGGYPCPWCRYFNPNDADRCGRCGQRLPSPGVAKALRWVGGPELLATKALVGLNVLVFALQCLDARSIGASAVNLPISTALRFGALSNGLELAEPSRLLAACFVHLGFLHLIFNMSALVQLGRVGESALGSARFLVTYVLTGIAGFAVSGVWYAVGEGGKPYITAGASGAIFGITGLVVAGLAVRRDPRWKEILIQQLIYSFIMYYALHTNQAAHLGGLALGIALGLLFFLESPRWHLAPIVTTLAAACALAIPASLALPQRSPLWREARSHEALREQRRRFREPAIEPLPEPPRAPH